MLLSDNYAIHLKAEKTQLPSINIHELLRVENFHVVNFRWERVWVEMVFAVSCLHKQFNSLSVFAHAATVYT